MRSYSDSLSRCIWMALLLVIMLFSAVAIDPLKLNSRVGLTTPVSADSGEGWYMDGAQVTKKGHLEDYGGCSGKTMSISDGTAIGSVSCTVTSPYKCSGRWTGTAAWTPPPAFMQPGSKINFTESVKTTGPSCGYNIGSSGGIYVDGGNIINPSDAYTPGTGASATGTYTVRTGKPDAKLVITVTMDIASIAGNSATYNYIYRSSGTGTGTTTGTGTGTGTGTTTGAGWSGTWTYPPWGNVTITQSGNQLTFVWANKGYGTMTGTVSGNKFTGTNLGTYPGATPSGFEITLAPDGQSMTSLQTSQGVAAGKYTFTRVGSSTVPGTTTATTTGTGAALIAESRTAAPNSTVQVPIRLDKAGSIGSMNFVLTYNAQVLKVNKVDGGSLVSGALFTPNFKTPPQVRFGLATSGGISGSGSVAYIEFQVIGAAGSSSPLTLSEVDTTDTSGKSVILITQNGTVTVASGAAGGTGGKIKGDYNGDGKVTELDALAALKMSVKLLLEDLNLDMDGTGKVTAEDARLILKKALGK